MLKAPHFVISDAVALGILVCGALRGDDGIGAATAAHISPSFPKPVTEEDVAAWKANSPFLRTLDPSKSLVLTGIAHLDGGLFATLFDRDTKETHIVTGSANPQGWQIAGIEGDEANPQTVAVKISMPGGEIFPVRFDEGQLKPAQQAPRIPPDQMRRIAEQARNFKDGISGDGFRGPPPPEVAKKLSRLSEEQRRQLIYRIGELRNRGVSSEERQAIFVRMIDRTLQDAR